MSDDPLMNKVLIATAEALEAIAEQLREAAEEQEPIEPRSLKAVPDIQQGHPFHTHPADYAF